MLTVVHSEYSPLYLLGVPPERKPVREAEMTRGWPSRRRKGNGRAQRSAPSSAIIHPGFQPPLGPLPHNLHRGGDYMAHRVKRTTSWSHGSGLETFVDVPAEVFSSEATSFSFLFVPAGTTPSTRHQYGRSLTHSRHL